MAGFEKFMAVATIAVFAGFGAFSWVAKVSLDYKAEAVPAKEIAAAPSGCIADTVQKELAKASGPMSRRAYEVITRECEAAAADAERDKANKQALEQQRAAAARRQA